MRKDGIAGRHRRRPFDRILIANRGEIAVRIIRACRELGVGTVAVYSDADASAIHVRMADVAIRLGPAAADQSYLRADALVEVARSTGCQAVHPGYGFLAERAAFARAVEGAGLVFIGPTSATIESLGDKLNARRLAASLGVPVVPGTLEPAAIGAGEVSPALLAEGKRIGFPLLVKAAAGGGGRGMRRVGSSAELRVALVAAASEAAAAFGDGSVYLEKEIPRARHVEVQLLGDADGDVAAIGERDCSIQRRHQKLVEEAPAPGLAVAERKALHELAIRLGKAAGLQNAATAEFLFTPSREAFFLEVNTRLQVEHGVTELVSGLDLVHEQLWLAAGRPLSRRVRRAAARAATPDRHAIEVRLTAEDPAREFVPTPGPIIAWSMPSGPGVRVDAGVQAGERVANEYDNLLAKLLVVAEVRAAAVKRLERALLETEIAGIQTTLPFHLAVARSAAFVPEALSTGWVEEHWDGPGRWRRAAGAAQLAAALAMVDAGPGGRGTLRVADGSGPAPDAGRRNPGPRRREPSTWRLAGRETAMEPPDR